MKARMIVPALVAALLAAGPVLAKDMAPADQCKSLEKQLDSAIKKHGKAPKAEAAKMARKEGAALCASGDAAGGAAKLKQAMVDIGAKAK
jgi:hypothetical protein